MKHSKIGASSCERFWYCPGSINACADIPPEPTSSYAEEGTAAHELAEKCLRSFKQADEYVGGKAENGYVFTEEMAENVQIYIDTIRADLQKVLGDDVSVPRINEVLSIEKGFHLSWIDSNAFGTNDANVAQPFGILRVYDYKHGAGKVVEVKDNKQLLYYALGALEDGDYDAVEIVIVQPRAPHTDGPVRRWRVSVADLLEFGAELHQRIQATKKSDAPLVAGRWCTFCPKRNHNCPALSKSVQEAAMVDFHDAKIALAGPEDLSPEQLTKILQSADLINTWVASVMVYAQSKAEAGQHIPGFKLVKKKSNRQWKDAGEVEKAFKNAYQDDIYVPKKMKTPAQMEIVVTKLSNMTKGKAKEAVDEHTVKPDAGNALVPIADPREPVAGSAIADFSEEKEDSLIGDLF